MPLVRAGRALPHHAEVVVVLDAEVVARTEPRTVRGRGQQAERHLLDAGADVGRGTCAAILELPARIGMVDSVEAVVPAVLQREERRTGVAACIDAEEFEFGTAARSVIKPTVVEADSASKLETGRLVVVVLRRHCGRGSDENPRQQTLETARDHDESAHLDKLESAMQTGHLND